MASNTRAVPMPQRPWAHEQEAESRNAFFNFAPPGWDCRNRAVDYGIDLDVEIFRNGQATGAQFGVQLKSVREQRGEPRVRIALATLRYWRSQDVPVLLVLWNATTKSGHYIWAHQIDNRKVGENQRTLTVRPPRTNALDVSAHASIEAEVFARRAWAISSQQLPLYVRCAGRGTVSGVAAGKVVNRTRTRLAQFPTLVTSTRGLGPIEVRISVADNEIRADVTGGPPASFGYSHPIAGSESETTEVLAADAIFALALQYYRLNLTIQAAELISSVLTRSAMARGPALGQAVAVLLAANDVPGALRLIKIATKSDDALQVMFTAMALASANPDQASTAARVVADWAAELATDGNRGAASNQFYNAANHLRASDPRLAAQLLAEAAELDPSYRGRAYWWKDLGASNFMDGDYSAAADAYGQAIALGDADARPLYGDALLFSGRYTDGITELAAALDDTEIRHAEWRLKVRGFRALITEFGPSMQIRDSEEAERLLGDGDSPSACEQSLEADVLYGPALFSLAVIREAAGSPDADLAICAAFALGGNPMAWLLAIDCASSADRNDMIDVLVTAKRFASAPIMDFLNEIGMEEEAEAYADLFRELPADGVSPTIVRSTKFGSVDYEEVGHDDLIEGLSS